MFTFTGARPAAAAAVMVSSSRATGNPASLRAMNTASLRESRLTYPLQPGCGQRRGYAQPAAAARLHCLGNRPGDRGHGGPVPGTETGRVTICPVRGPLESVEILGAAAGLRHSTVRMNRVRCHTKADS